MAMHAASFTEDGWAFSGQCPSLRKDGRALEMDGPQLL